LFLLVLLRLPRSTLFPYTTLFRSTFSAYTNRADFRLAEGAIVFENKPVLRLNQTKLRGSHNIENLMATLAAGHARGLAFEKMVRSEEHTSELQSRFDLVCRLLLEK